MLSVTAVKFSLSIHTALKYERLNSLLPHYYLILLSFVWDVFRHSMKRQTEFVLYTLSTKMAIEIEKENILGKGGFATVYKVSRKSVNSVKR